MTVIFKTEVDNDSMYKAYIKVNNKNGVNYREDFEYPLNNSIDKQEEKDIALSNTLERLFYNISRKESSIK